MAAGVKEKKELTLEENFDLLGEITEKLQSDDLPLEEAFEYEDPYDYPDDDMSDNSIS